MNLGKIKSRLAKLGGTVEFAAKIGVSYYRVNRLQSDLPDREVAAKFLSAAKKSYDQYWTDEEWEVIQSRPGKRGRPPANPDAPPKKNKKNVDEKGEKKIKKKCIDAAPTKKLKKMKKLKKS